MTPDTTSGLQPVLVHLTETRVAVSTERNSKDFQSSRLKFVWDIKDIAVLGEVENHQLNIMNDAGL